MADSFSYNGVGPLDPDWSSWRWQYANRITTADELSQVIPLSEDGKADIERCLGRFRMAITPYYASLIDPDDPGCPIRAQAVPDARELVIAPCEMADPLDEDAHSPLPNLVHRYPDRVLLLVTEHCAMYCRHCTRRRIVGDEDRVESRAQVDKAVAYIAEHEEIRDVLISGGDPLTLKDAFLEYTISHIRAIKHVEIIRIGTRVPVTMPMRITPALLDMLKCYQPLWINTHFNHPRELTPEAVSACEAIVDAGIPLGNQSVLLHGVNDDASTMRELLLGLVKARIRPYYLYQCDMSEGLWHFRTPLDAGPEIIGELSGKITGFAIPRFVVDMPGGGGKIAIAHDTVVSREGGTVTLRNFEGRLCVYPDISQGGTGAGPGKQDGKEAQA